MAREFLIRQSGDTVNLPELLPDGIDIKRVDSEISPFPVEILPPEGKTIENSEVIYIKSNLEAITVRQDTFGNYWLV